MKEIFDKLAEEANGFDLEKETEVDWKEYLQQTADEDGLQIFEALSATGLRSIRYFNEVRASG